MTKKSKCALHKVALPPFSTWEIAADREPTAYEQGIFAYQDELSVEAGDELYPGSHKSASRFSFVGGYCYAERVSKYD